MITNKLIYDIPLTNEHKIVVIGDIHGDLKRLKKILIDALIINENMEWIAQPQNTIVIQMGDQIDSANRMPNLEEWEVLTDINTLHFTNNLDIIISNQLLVYFHQF